MTAHPLTPREFSSDSLISVVLPVYNEAAVLDVLHRRIVEALSDFGCRFEIVFVNDGSSDASAGSLDALAVADSRVRVVHFSRNFGQQAAVHAGLLHATGDCVAVMDSDLQDDPSALVAFLEKWREGYDIVYAVRASRKEGFVKRFLFAGFYRLLMLVSRTPMPLDAGNFGLVDRRVVVELTAILDHDRYFPGLRSWLGFRQAGVVVQRQARYDNMPKVSLIGLFRLAKSAFFSFSALPLTVFYAIAIFALVVFCGLAAFTLYHKLLTGEAIPGWTSQIMVACFFGALNALGIAVLGEYVIRIYDQVRGRPLFVIDRVVNLDPIRKCPTQDRAGAGN